MLQKRPGKSNIRSNTREDKSDWWTRFSLCAVTVLLILKQPISVDGDDSRDEDDGPLFCCQKSEDCGMNVSDCGDLPNINEWSCGGKQFNLSFSIFLRKVYHDTLYPEVEFSWLSKDRVFIKTSDSPSRSTCYSVSGKENDSKKVCSRLSHIGLHVTFMQQIQDSMCSYSSLLINALSAYNLYDLEDPETWASYLIVRYDSVISSINVTFHQADNIAVVYPFGIAYNIELLKRAAPSNHSPFDIYERKIVHHVGVTGLERTVLFNNVSDGVYYVRFQLEADCITYCPYMNSEEIIITEMPDKDSKPEVPADLHDNKLDAGKSTSPTGELPNMVIALVVTGCLVFTICLFLLLMLFKRKRNLSLKELCSTYHKPPDIYSQMSPPLTLDTIDKEEPKQQSRKVFIVYTPETMPSEGSCPHEDVVRCFVDLLVRQLEMDVQTVDLCIRDVRRLKPRKWVHRQLEVCDVIVIVNSEGAMERVKASYFRNEDEVNAELKNAKIIENVFDIAMEGIMARLQSGQIRDCPSRYAVVTFPHSHSVESLIPYLSTEMNYRLMSDWHDFCMHVQDFGKSSPELQQASYQTLSTDDGLKLQRAIDNALAHYTWNHIGTVDNTESTHHNVCPVLEAAIMTSHNDCNTGRGATMEQWLPSNNLDSGFQSEGLSDQTALDRSTDSPDINKDNCQQSTTINHTELPDSTQPLLPSTMFSHDLIPPNLMSSRETLSTTVSESNNMVHMQQALRNLRNINDLPMSDIC